jgi:predicted PurR-regulated permease PerM
VPTIKDEDSPESFDDIWASAAQMARVGIFVILLVTCLYVGRAILLPVVAAVVTGTTLAPLVKAAARCRVPPWLTAGVLALALVAATGTAATFLAKPVTDWIARAPEIGATIKQKLYVLDRPLAAMRELPGWSSKQTPMLECGNAGFGPTTVIGGQICCDAQYSPDRYDAPC